MSGPFDLKGGPCDCGKGPWCPQYGAAFNVRKLSDAALVAFESEAFEFQRRFPTNIGAHTWDAFNAEIGRRGGMEGMFK